MSSIADRLNTVHSAISAAAERSGRRIEDIALVAVSKTHPPEALREALDAGQSLFGESRVQEARAKIPLLPGRARWHFIGHLQKNKIRHALALGFELFHGIDSLETAGDLDRIANEAGVFPKVLLEVNVAGESTKFGFDPATIRSRMEELLALGRMQIEGLMTIAPYAPEAESARAFFTALRELRDSLQSEFRVPLPHLSMGMSGDYGVAIEEGATIVRIGTAIFGTRSGKAWKPAGDASSFAD
jgi:pyridoxal phosphate enzyme (YggS family)